MNIWHRLVMWSMSSNRKWLWVYCSCSSIVGCDNWIPWWPRSVLVKVSITRFYSYELISIYSVKSNNDIPALCFNNVRPLAIQKVVCSWIHQMFVDLTALQIIEIPIWTLRMRHGRFFFTRNHHKSVINHL